jgi:serine/threonine protein phosphatase 1
VESFQALLSSAGFSEEDFLYILGDVVDRGEHGAELLSWITRQSNVQLLLGNHEDMLLNCDFLFREVTQKELESITEDQAFWYRNWMRNGAGPTVRGLQELLHRDPELVEGILEYLREAPLYACVKAGGEEYVLVHSGLGNFRRYRPLKNYSRHDLLWERPTADTVYYSGKTVIFGHTPTVFYGEEHRGRELRTDTWICIDAGAAMGEPPMLLRLDDRKAFYGKRETNET